MSFEAQITAAIMDPVEQRRILKVAAAALADGAHSGEESDEERSSRRRRRALLLTLAGLAGLGTLGYAAYKSNLGESLRDKMTDYMGEPQPPNAAAQFMRQVYGATDPTTLTGLGALAVGGTTKPVQRMLPGWMRRALGVKSEVGIQDFIRNIGGEVGGDVSGDPGASVKSLSGHLGNVDSGKGAHPMSRLHQELSRISDPDKASVFKTIMNDPTVSVGDPRLRTAVPAAGATSIWDKIFKRKDVRLLDRLRQGLEGTIGMSERHTAPADSSLRSRINEASSRIGQLTQHTGLNRSQLGALAQSIRDWQAAPGSSSPLAGGSLNLGKSIARGMAPAVVLKGVPWASSFFLE